MKRQRISNLNYRKDLTGLRGIAILSVLLFHSGLPYAQGGYAGVDVFFVLSGYFITKSIESDITNNCFSIFSFYHRRLLRILPAAIVVIIAVGIVGAKLLFPEELIELAESSLAFLTLRSNLWAAKSISYFGIGVDYKPLIHYWSLSIELQCYLIFPLLIALLIKGNRNKLILISTLIFAASVIYAGLYANKNPDKAYFSSLMRIWEFALGAILGVSKTNKHIVRCQTINLLTALGYALVIASVFIFDEQSSFPGFLALVPCIGASIIICFGSDQTFFSKIFSNKPLVFIGRISFSLYLVHQPILAFYRTLSGRGLQGLEPEAIIAASVATGALLYFTVEKPFQIKKNTFRSTILAMPIIALACMSLYFSKKYSEKPVNEYSIPTQSQKFLQYRYDNNPRISECRTSNKIIDPDAACLYGKPGGKKAALWGDSHVDQLVYPLSKEFEKLGYSILEFSISGCPPITEIESALGQRKCTENSERILNYLAYNNEIEYVILHAYWIGYLDEGLIQNASKNRTLEESFQSVLRILINAGKKVYLIYPVPKMKVNPPLFLARRALFEQSLENHVIELSEQDYLLQSAKSRRFLMDSTKDLSITPIYLADLLFDSARSTYISFANNKLLYRDDNHLSVSGAEYIAEALTRQILGTNNIPRAEKGLDPR